MTALDPVDPPAVPSPSEGEDEDLDHRRHHAAAPFISGVDDEGWCLRVWDQYMRESVEHGHGRPEEGPREVRKGWEPLEPRKKMAAASPAPTSAKKICPCGVAFDPRNGHHEFCSFDCWRHERAERALAAEPRPHEEDEPMGKSGKSNGSRTGEETKAVYAKLESELGRPPIYKEVAKALGIGDSAASMRLAILRKRGDLPRVGVRSHVVNGAKATNGHASTPRAKASRTSSRSSGHAASALPPR